MSDWFTSSEKQPKDGELVWCSNYGPSLDYSDAKKCYYSTQGWNGSHFIAQDTMSPYGMAMCYWQPLSPVLKLGHGVADNLTSLLTVLESFVKGIKK